MALLILLKPNVIAPPPGTAVLSPKTNRRAWWGLFAAGVLWRIRASWRGVYSIGGPGWRAALRFTARQCAKNGLRIGIHCSLFNSFHHL